MRIKKLEIHGFKSFADRGTLHFGDGITGVVGPNGCGKSNIVDAIRWCMGEMSAKHLRGKAMQDVIFAGSDSRGPSGFAEVTLTFHNDGEVPPQFAAYSEISVTRRLHKDGNSEYLINKATVRLRDITDLFLGTGVGTRAYSIIEQGRIGFIVSSKPEDRRTLLEEVAGITRFKARKKSAERRLESTEQNLTRVNDIVSELERQLNSLKRQARKAERFRSIKDELRGLELHCASVEFLRYAAIEKLQVSERQKLDGQLEDSTQFVDESEAKIDAERERLSKQEEKFQEEQEATAQVESALAALERDLKHWEHQRSDADGRRTSATKDVESWTKQRTETEEECGRLRSLASDLDSETEGLEARIDSSKVTLEERATRLTELEQAWSEARAESLEVVQSATQTRSRVAELERLCEQVEIRLQGYVDEERVLQQELVTTEQKLEELDVAKVKADTDRSTWMAERDTKGEQLEQTQTEADALKANLEQLRDTLTQRRSRLDSLKDIADRFEGYGDGVQSLMTGEGRPDDVAAGLQAPIGTLIEVPNEYERAIEAVLGERLQYVLARDRTAAVQGLRYLNDEGEGRAGILPLHRNETGAISSELPGKPAASVVNCEETLRPALNALLMHVRVVDSMEEAFGARTMPGGQSTTWVTTDGDVLEPSGALVGGNGGGQSLLAQQREMRELEDQVATLEAELQVLREQSATVNTRRLQLEVDIEQLKKDLHALELEQLDRNKDIESLNQQKKRLALRAETLASELERSAQDAERLKEEQSENIARMEELNRKQQAVQERVDTSAEEVTSSRAGLESAKQEHHQDTVVLASAREKVKGWTKSISQLEQLADDLGGRIERAQESIRSDGERSEELAQKLAQEADRAEGLRQDAASRREALQVSRTAYDEAKRSLDEVEEALRLKRRERELAQEALVQVKMDVQRCRIERDNLCTQMRERHDVALTEILSDYHMIAPPTEEMLGRRRELDRSLKSLGSVNLTAIDEFKEVDERHAFLTQQRDDLEEAVRSLRLAIQQINRTSRARFREAFDAVNEMFQTIYPRLFRGGVARLELTAAEDVLDAGVDIVAQPPGKKLQNVGLLSGGEKALTATALIFAIFLVKPSPFCILDEVDAPLDEANVGRFNDMLAEMSDMSQFIVITHNKRTMTVSDRLYGVTMEEPGMSKIVSVDFDAADDQAAA